MAGRLTGFASQSNPDARARLTRLSTATASPVNGRLVGLSTRVVAQVRGRLVGLVSGVAQGGSIAVPGRANLEPGVPVTVTADASGAASAWSWSSNFPGLQLTVSGASVTYTPPGTLNGVTVTLTATATIGGQSVSGSASHFVLPHAGQFTYTSGGVLKALYASA